MLVFIALLSSVSSSQIAAQSHQPIQDELHSYLTEKLQPQRQPGDDFSIEINPISPHLQLTACATALHFDPVGTIAAGRFNVKTSCDRPKRWAVYVSGDIRLHRPVVVSQTSIPKDSALNTSNVSLQVMDVTDLYSKYLTDLDQLNSYQAKTPIKPNSIITVNQLEPKLLVLKDDEVIIRSGKAGVIEVRMAGIALEPGSYGEQIRVENKKSGKVIRARVIATGQVAVGR